ncbi:hypothetical protein H5410_048923 [Solanum commersonii]|uniref:PB1-like domain-containing protein n=1 Tax=Solanum commersonii TaxID=4109 RepID=A0A9J5XJL5_SOLCO|nr:hypothetical protein H5410_048923 [Solanum commersonii]
MFVYTPVHEMSGFTLVTLKWYHGGVLDLSSGQLVYSGGQVTEFLDVDVDRLSYFELRGYIKELGYTTTCTFSIKPPNSGILEDIHNDMDILDLSCSLEDGDIVEVYVKHLIDNAVVDPTLILLENVPHGDMEECGSTFNKVNEQSGIALPQLLPPQLLLLDLFSLPLIPLQAAPKSPSTKTPPTIAAAPRSPSTTTHRCCKSYEDSVESECGLVGDDDEDYGSDVHEEVRELRVKKIFSKKKRKESTGKISVEGRLGGDEPYFASSDDGSFEIDEDEFSDECVESERVHLPRSVYFNSQVKCDYVDNNTSKQCFNSWILAARHKTIITMLDEIRVKMMTRIAKLREFTNTWMCDFSPMSLKVLKENIDRSMNCNIEFNGVDGFEVKEGPFQHD